MKEISEPRYGGKQNNRDGDQLYHLTLGPLSPQQQRESRHSGTAALGHKQTHALQ
jgi:hypothetical protein